MKKITDINQLKQDIRLVNFIGHEPHYYQFFCIHPHNDQYVLLFDELTEDAIKFFIPNITGPYSKWYIDFDQHDIYMEQIEILSKMIKNRETRMEEYDSLKKK